MTMPQYPQYPKPQPTPMPEVAPGSVPGKGRTYIEAGPGALLILFCIFYFLGFGYMLALGIFYVIADPSETFGFIAIGICLAFLLPVIFLLPNFNGIYENGIKVSRPLILRLLGKHAFFKYEDILAVYPAVFSSSAQLASPQPGWYHPVGYNWTKYGQGASAFGHVFGKLITDSGQRNGLAIETSEGRFILTLSSLGNSWSPYQQMMPYVQYSMGVRNLPLVRKPLRLSDQELADAFGEAVDIPFKWYVTAAFMALGMPFIVMIVAAGIILATQPRLSEWNVPIIIFAVIISTTFFVALYQGKTTKGNNAKNRINYYYASQPSQPTVAQETYYQAPAQAPIEEEPTEKIWDPSQR